MFMFSVFDKAMICNHNRLKDRTFGSVFWNQAKSVSSLNSKIKEARWKTAKQLEDIFGAEADEMKKVLPRHICQIWCFDIEMHVLLGQPIDILSSMVHKF
jgi:hypothetical protein